MKQEAKTMCGMRTQDMKKVTTYAWCDVQDQYVVEKVEWVPVKKNVVK